MSEDSLIKLNQDMTVLFGMLIDKMIEYERRLDVVEEEVAGLLEDLDTNEPDGDDGSRDAHE